MDRSNYIADDQMSAIISRLSEERPKYWLWAEDDEDSCFSEGLEAGYEWASEANYGDLRKVGQGVRHTLTAKIAPCLICSKKEECK